MEKETVKLIEKILGPYADSAIQALNSQDSRLQQLLRHRKLPEKGWDVASIEFFLHKLSVLDSNNFAHQAGTGEREGRICCPLVAARCYGMAHGIGRSGDVTALQPKAAGSSLLNQLCNSMVLDAIRLAGIRSCKSCFVIPAATGMALTLCLLYLRKKNPVADKVIWSRIDQKTCFKCIITAGLTPVVVDPVLVGDALQTNTRKIEELLNQFGEEVLCCYTTVSCFAPRVPDDIETVAKLCSEMGVPHLVNNAYGLQASKCCHLLEQAARVGRVDVFVQSTDKNFMVPVGGAIIAGFESKVVQEIAKCYPGRASASPCLDLLTTLLYLGSEGWLKWLKSRKAVFLTFKEKLSAVAEKHGERILETKNPISLAFTMHRFDLNYPENNKTVTEIGSMLFTRGCTGARAVVRGESKEVEGRIFEGWGSHCSSYPVSYLNFAGAIGMTEEEVNVVVAKLDKILTSIHKRKRNSMTEEELLETLKIASP